MKIVHLTTVDMSLRLLLLAQIDAAISAGHEVIGVSAPGPHVPYLRDRGLRHIALDGSTRSMNPLADLRAARHLWRILRDERPDVLHTHNPKPGWYGRVVGRLAGVPVVVNTVHGLYATPDDPPLRRGIVYALEAIASRFSDVELVQNPEDLELLARLRLVPREKLVLLGNGVDLQRFRPDVLDASELEDLRSSLGIGAEEVVIGTVGRLVLEKGYLDLFEAARHLPEAARLVVVGPEDPEKHDAVPATALAEARRNGTIFLGHRDDVESVYPLFDVFVLPSYREGFPRAAMEAAAAGVPVVATDIRGCRQVVADGDNGLLVPAADPSRLAAALRSLVEDRALRRSMAAASRRKAEAEFDEASVVRIVTAAYSGLSADGPSASTQGAKRAVDLVVGSLALIGLSPVIASVAAAIRLRMGRPVLFRQLRPGRDGELFTIFKFRTMASAVGATGEPLPDEERLTPLGRKLREWSLDELPELVNVLRGEMSLVGPRPLLPEYLAHYTPAHARRHEVRPGMTGWAQVNGRNATSWAERLDMDVWYVDHWSLRLDLQILLRTLRTVFVRGGIAHEGHVTMPKFVADGDARVEG